MKRLKRSLLKIVTSLAVAALPAIGGAQTAPAFHVTNLSPAPLSCVFDAIGDSGVAVGNCSSNAATWSNGTYTNLGRLSTGAWANATAINSLGTVAGDADPGNGRPNAFITYNGGLLNIDPISGGNARAIGILDSGVVFGNLTKSLSGGTSSWNVVMWTQDPGHPDRYKENFLPHYPGGDSKFNGVYGTASNKAGQVVGWVTTSVIGQLGGFWNNDSAHTVVTLQPLPNGNHSIAWGVNDLGQAVGESNTLTTSTEAVMWQNDAAHSIVDLGALPGDTFSAAAGINTAGQIVGTSAPGMFSGTPRAFLYQNGAMYDLATLVDPTGGFWTIDYVFAINNAGQILAMGTTGGIRSSILLTPIVQ